jgi:anti-anti-sigma factor
MGARVKDRLAEVVFESHGGAVVARLSGEVDVSNAGDLGRALVARVPSDATGIVLDLGAVTYLDSSAINMLFELGRRLDDRRQQLLLAVPGRSRLIRVLELSGLERVAPIHTTTEAALASVRGGERR